MQQKIALFWFRRDLRLHDNAGLYAALSSGLPVLPLFIFDKIILDRLDDKDDKRVSFIYDALLSIQEKLAAQHSSLLVKYGAPGEVFTELIKRYSIDAVYTNHDYEPYATSRDKEIAELLKADGIAFYSYKDQVIFERNEVEKDDGNGYSIYTPYAKKWKSLLTKERYRTFASEDLIHKVFKQKPLVVPSLKAMGFVRNETGVVAAKPEEDIIKHYHQTRNIPSLSGTTRMGVHLRFGTISVRQLAEQAVGLNDVYLNELIWREFFMQMLWRQPRLVNEACKKSYDEIKWRNDENEFAKWCAGETGYPIVDAGMRELNATGFMHNRVRMIAGSFLVKDLLVDWRWGEAYFARKLLDYDLSSNNGNWQWVAGCGCDAAPYFRVFNPTLQAKKFDPKNSYIKKWVPEFETKAYPKPIVNHDEAKQRCLKAYKAALLKIN